MRRRLLLIALLVGIGLVVAFVLRPRDDPREGSTLFDDRGVIMPSGSVPMEYSITYRMDDGSTNEISVRRPFDGRTANGGDRATFIFGRFTLSGQPFYAPPEIVPVDRRPDAVLPEAVEDGYAERREVREVLGRKCLVYRLGDGSDAASLPPLSDGGSVTDVCVDRNWLILEEVRFDGDEIADRSVATDVDLSPRLDVEMFEIDEPKGDPRQVGSVQQLEDDSPAPGATFWELDTEPKGFELHGRYAVVPPGQPGFTEVEARGSIVALFCEVWTDGADVLVIEQGATQGSKPFEDDPNARRVDGNELGRGELRYSLRESEARFLTGGARFVRVRGTLAPSSLLAIARRLEERPGGELQLAD